MDGGGWGGEREGGREREKASNISEIERCG